MKLSDLYRNTHLPSSSCVFLQQQQQKSKNKDLTGDSVDGKVWFVHLFLHVYQYACLLTLKTFRVIPDLLLALTVHVSVP